MTTDRLRETCKLRGESEERVTTRERAVQHILAAPPEAWEVWWALQEDVAEDEGRAAFTGPIAEALWRRAPCLHCGSAEMHE